MESNDKIRSVASESTDNPSIIGEDVTSLNIQESLEISSQITDAEIFETADMISGPGVAPDGDNAEEENSEPDPESLGMAENGDVDGDWQDDGKDDEPTDKETHPEREIPDILSEEPKVTIEIEEPSIPVDYQTELDAILESEEFKNYVDTQNNFEATLHSLKGTLDIIREGGFKFQDFSTEYNDLINQSGWTKKEFDIIGLQTNPEDGIVAKEWFESVSKALDLIDKAMKNEEAPALKRVPPRLFRACLKQTSRFDPVTTLSTLTPMYSLKKDLRNETLFVAVLKCVNCFYSYSKWMLSAEKRITTDLLKSLKLEEDIKNVATKLGVSVKGNLDKIKEKLNINFLCDKDSADQLSDEEIDLIQNARQLLIDESRLLYDKNEKYLSITKELEESFFKKALSDIYKLFNDLYKTTNKFDDETREITDSDDKEFWKGLLISIKDKIEVFLSSLNVYRNPDVIENSTIWDDKMDYVEIIDADDDDSHENGMISQVHNIGFHRKLGEDKKDYLELTRVTIYRNSQS